MPSSITADIFASSFQFISRQPVTAIISPDSHAIALSTTLAWSSPSRYAEGGMASTVPAKPVMA